MLLDPLDPLAPMDAPPGADISISREHLAGLVTRVSTILVRGHDLQETLQLCCEDVLRQLGAVLARIWTLDDAGSVLELQASSGLFEGVDGPYNRVPIGDFAVGRIAQHRKRHLTNDVIADLVLDDSDWARREGISTFAGCPLLVEDRLVGVLGLFSRRPLPPGAGEDLEVIADGIALGIERLRSESQLREQAEVLSTIHRIGQLLSAELDQQKLVQAVTDAATELTGARFGSFFYNVLNEQGASYMLYTLSGVPRHAFAHFPMPRATDLFGPTFRGEGTIRIADVKADPRYGHSSPYYGLPPGHLPVVSYLAVPVVSRSKEVIGGLFFGHPEPGAFTEWHERIIEGLAAQTAIAMDNARLYSSAQQLLRDRESLLASEQSARREAEMASHAKDEFLSLLSHELRTPLNAILGWVRLLGTNTLDGDTQARAIDTIDRNARLQARLIEDMLDVSRIISGKLRLDAQAVDLSTVIHAAVDTLRPAADARGIRVHMVLDFGAGQVWGDPVRLQQVAWNLLSNAIKFTPKGGSVQVQLARVNSHLELVVSDTGPGIDAEFLPFVFDRFRQADATITRKHGGLGLGLAIVRHLVELHGGIVEAGNRTDRSGAVVAVKLPLMAVRAPTPVSPASQPSAAESPAVHPATSGPVSFECPPQLIGIRVLAVDDEADARLLLQQVLEQCGAEVRTCGSAAEALTALAEWTPDILVSDVGMPGEDGYSLIRKVRAAESGGAGGGVRLPAVALTAYARVEDRLQALSAGYNMHVPKPVEPAELAVVIASLTGQAKKP
ncbi:MAG TPA: GAF domain-containing protein [Thermoanaerobaculia bacterium]|nr:GAF domain-containing protein [Thermoanaerobaculia bacterium]